MPWKQVGTKNSAALGMAPKAPFGIAGEGMGFEVTERNPSGRLPAKNHGVPETRRAGLRNKIVE